MSTTRTFEVPTHKNNQFSNNLNLGKRLDLPAQNTVYFERFIPEVLGKDVIIPDYISVVVIPRYQMKKCENSSIRSRNIFVYHINEQKNL